MALKVNLEKAKVGLKLSLEKKGIPVPPRADVGMVLDVSGSFDDELRDGTAQHLVERLVPWAMVFDPDQKVDVFTFSSGRGSAHRVGDLTPATLDGYIARYVVNKVPGYGSATDYSYVIELVLKTFGWLDGAVPQPAPEKSGGFFSNLFGKKPTPAPAVPAAKRRSLVLFITDGDNGDHDRARQMLRESQKRKDGVYFIFLGVSNQGARFPFLESIGDEFDNTAFVSVNLRWFLAASDDEINERMIGDELLAWLKQP